MKTTKEQLENLDLCMKIAMWGGIIYHSLWIAFVVFATYTTGRLNMAGWESILLFTIAWMGLKIKRDAVERAARSESPREDLK